MNVVFSYDETGRPVRVLHPPSFTCRHPPHIIIEQYRDFYGKEIIEREYSTCNNSSVCSTIEMRLRALRLGRLQQNFLTRLLNKKATGFYKNVRESLEKKRLIRTSVRNEKKSEAKTVVRGTTTTTIVKKTVKKLIVHKLTPSGFIAAQLAQHEEDRYWNARKLPARCRSARRPNTDKCNISSDERCDEQGGARALAQQRMEEWERQMASFHNGVAAIRRQVQEGYRNGTL